MLFKSWCAVLEACGYIIEGLDGVGGGRGVKGCARAEKVGGAVGGVEGGGAWMLLGGLIVWWVGSLSTGGVAGFRSGLSKGDLGGMEGVRA